MCVAIYKPKGVKLTKDTLAKCFKQNPDGCGFAVHVAKPDAPTAKPYIWQARGFFKFADFWKEWEQYDTAYDAIVHFRIATHGSVRTENCHPFVFKAKTLGDKPTETQYAFAHNGVMSHFSNLANTLPGDKSDTRIFGERVLEGLAVTVGPSFMENTRILNYLENRLSGNKVIVMRDDGKVVILNERLGDWRTMEGGKVWFSNTHWDVSFRSQGRMGYVFTGDTSGTRCEPWGNQSRVSEEEDIWENYLNRRANVGAAARHNIRPDDATFNDGVVDAYAGAAPFFPRNARYVEGYYSVLIKRGSDPLFVLGYVDAMAGNLLQEMKGLLADRIYRLGFVWGQFESHVAATDDKVLHGIINKVPLPANFMDLVETRMTLMMQAADEGPDAEETEADNAARANKTILSNPALLKH